MTLFGPAGINTDQVLIWAEIRPGEQIVELEAM